MVHDSLETSIKAKDTMWIKHVYGQQLQYQPEKKKDEHHRLCITTHSDHQRIPIPDEVFARDENQKSRNVLGTIYKTKQKLFSFLIIFVHTPS